MPFSRSPTSRLLIESQVLTIDLGMTLTFIWHWPQISQTKLNWCTGSKISIFMRSPWPWSNNPDTQTWPRYGQDVTPYQKWSFYVNCFKSYSLNRPTDRHTHRQKHRYDENITSTAYAEVKIIHSYAKTLHPKKLVT